MPPPSVEARVAALHRQHYRALLAPLIRVLGSFATAEDVVQEAYARALSRWPSDGVPDEPLAWLRRVAKNAALDRRRRDARWRDKADALRRELPVHAEIEIDDTPLADDALRLIFTCCHPALSPEAQVGLTLRTVCGLTSDEVARAFLLPRATLQQRLVRAKKKLDHAGIRYAVPEPEHLPARLGPVLRAVYLVFNEGYGASQGEALIRLELCDEAIRLGRLLALRLPQASGPQGLLALMLLHHARREARVDPAGNLVRLEDQDRARWDAAAIEEALPLVEAALRARPPSTYAIEAAIAALHARAQAADRTDWAQISALYAALEARSGDRPVVQLNAAVAQAMAGDLQGGLERLDALAATARLARYHLLPAARADLLARLDRPDEAREAYDEALAKADNAVERRFLSRRRAALDRAAEKIEAAVDPARPRSSGG